MVIDTLELNIVVDNKGTTARINNTTNALKNLHKVISDINGAGGVDGVVNGGGGIGSSSRGGSSRSSGSKSASKLAKSLNFGSMIAKLYFVRNITKQLGQDLAKVVQYGIDYEETLNLWQVAMKGNTAEARKFITEMNRAYGISEITLMNYQATFKNMLSSLGGINQEVAYGLSETLSQMALDYASLYNTSIESAMTKFQAVLAGQVRPIRSESGYDITQATLYEVYKDIGGTKSVRQLSESEKRLLRILAVYRQMKDTAVGDYAKTITSTANQTRYMSETIKDIATWIGVGANQWLKQSNILIRINAYLIALKELAKSFAINMGYVEESEEKADDPLGDIEKEWDGINKQVDEYQGKLLGFDKFQVLSSAEVGGDVDISAELLKAMQEYEEILGKSNNVALFGDAEKNIKGAYDILKDWGYEYDEQSKQWLKDGKTVKENIEDIAKSIGGLITFIGLMTKPWLVLVGAIEYAYWTNEDFRNSFNGMIKAVGSSGITIFRNFAEILKDISPALTAIVGGFADVISFLDRIGLLEFAIWGVVTAMIAWKTAQAAINIMKFYENMVKYLVPAITSASLAIKKQLAASLIAAQLDFGNFGLAMTSVTAQTLGFAAAIGLAFAVFTNWEYMNGTQRIVSVLGVLTVALLSAAIAFGAFHSAWSLGLAIAGIAAGIVAVTSAVNSAKANIDSMEVPKYAKGGLADKGSLFYAGEAGPELVTQTSGGGSTIMNMKQLEDAVARGFIRGFAATDNGTESDDTTEVYVDGQRLFNIMRNTAKRNGYDFVRV